MYEKLDAPIRSRASRWVGRQLCKRHAEFLEFHPTLLLGRRFQAIDVAADGVFDFAARLRYSERNRLRRMANSQADMCDPG